MEPSELWSNLEKHEVGRSHFFGRQLVSISVTDFTQYKDYFSVSYNPFNKKINYRTNDTFTHIHAVLDGEYIEFHFDYFNPDTCKLLAIPHFIFSVVPYFVWHLITRTRPYKIHL